MRSRKLTALLMTTVLCATSLFGCGGSEDETTTKAGENSTEVKPEDQEKTLTLKVWGNEDMTDASEGDWLKTMCEKFATEHPKWNITWEYGTVSEANAYTEASKDPKKAADVFFYANDQVKSLVEANCLSQFGTAASQYVKDTNSAAIVDSVTYNGGVYGIPFTTNLWFMYYDKSVYSAEDVKSLEKMMEKGTVGFDYHDAWYIESFFLATGCSFSETKYDFEGAKAEEALQYLVDAVASKKLVYNKGVGGLGDTVDVATSGSWGYDEAKKLLGDNLGICALPKINVKNGDGQLRCFSGSKAVGVNPNSADQYVAVELAKFLTNEYAQETLYEATGTIPCNTALLQQDKYKNDEIAIAANTVFDNTSILQPGWIAGWWGPAGELGNAVTGGTIGNVAEKVAEFNKALNDSLAK